MMENSNWKAFKLGEVTTKIGSGSTPTGGSNSYKDEGISLIRSQNILDLTFSKDGLAFIDDVQAYKLRSVIVEENDILFNITGDSVARVCKVPNHILPARVNQHVAILRADNINLNYDFLLYLMQSKKEELLIMSEIGATRNAITKVMLENLEIQLPPLPEQKDIASVLNSLDDKIDLLHQQNQTLEALAETLFRQWFIEEAKEDWEECTIGDLAIHSKISIYPKKNPDKLYYHYSIPAFDANKKPVVELGKEIQSNKYKVIENSILFSKLNPHKDKRVWLILDKVDDNAICSTELQVVKPKDNSYLYFVYGWLTNSVNYNEIASGVGGTSGSHQRIDPTAIFSAPCVEIEKEMILNYNKHAEPLFRKQSENQLQIQTLAQLRDNLLPKLMSGEVRVKN